MCLWEKKIEIDDYDEWMQDIIIWDWASMSYDEKCYLIAWDMLFIRLLHEFWDICKNNISYAYVCCDYGRDEYYEIWEHLSDVDNENP